METKTTICNKALALIGEEPINSYDDDTSLAGRACRLYFDSTLRTLLESGEWTNATVEEPLVKISDNLRKKLQPLEKPLHYHEHHEHEKHEENDEHRHLHHHHGKHEIRPDFGPRKELYNIPDDCTSIISVTPMAKHMHIPCPIKWQKKYVAHLGNSFIETDFPYPMVIKYVKNLNNMELFSAKFQKALYACLAADMCMYITKDLQKTQAIMQYAEAVKAEALRDNLNEGGNRNEPFIPASILARD